MFGSKQMNERIEAHRVSQASGVVQGQALPSRANVIL